MEFTLRTVAIAIIVVVVALVLISIIVSWGTGGKTLIDALMELIQGKIAAPATLP